MAMTQFCKSGDGSRRIEFVQPRSFVPADVLPTKLLTRADDCRWLVDLILRKTANRDTDPWGCVRLHSAILQRVMYQPTQAAVVRALVDAEVIDRAPHRAGHRSTGYRIGKRYLSDRVVRVPCCDPRLVDRVVRERERMKQEEQSTRWLPIHWQLAHEQTRLTITDEADEILMGLPDHTRLCQDVLVDRLRRREFNQSISSTGRLFNAITGLKRELRHALRLDNEPLGSVDLVSSQPALLGLLLTGKIPPSVPNQLLTYKHTPLAPDCSPGSLPALPSAPADVLMFASVVSRGRFYDVLSGLTGLDRPTVKLRFLVDVLAKKGRYPSTVESAFRKSFPSVYREIRRINQHDHAALIRALQRLESWLVVETVTPRLLAQRFPAVTLHDAIYSQRSTVGAVADAFAETFTDLDVSLSLHKEN